MTSDELRQGFTAEDMKAPTHLGLYGLRVSSDEVDARQCVHQWLEIAKIYAENILIENFWDRVDLGHGCCGHLDFYS
jgi:hypothetical protein